jgi:hypothetical protein
MIAVRTIEIERIESQPLSDVEAMVEGKVFHVTRRDAWDQIALCGEIRPNTDGSFATPFGSSNSYFRRRGCVSVFDFREPPTEEIRVFRTRCWPFQPAQPGNGGIAILLLKQSLHDRLIPWTHWKEESAYGEMVVPHVEAGHPGPIPTTEVSEVVFLRRSEDPNCLAAALRRARQNAG